MAADTAEDPDSWEDIDEEELLKRLQSRQREVAQQEKLKKTVVDTQPFDVNPSVCDGPLKIKYSEGTEYVAPIKILKRPDKPEEPELSQTGEVRTHKSLAQREAEYSSARARILGENSTSSNSSDVKLIRQPQGPSSNKKSFQRHPSSR